MAISLMSPGCDEWERAWQELARDEINGGDPVCENAATGESWQYLSTSDGKHLFRHRCHPKSFSRVFREIPVLGEGENETN
ncbi:hypothetical protein P3447_09725 [Vibrio parahaemolyticus]|nr:hypothetical protein [Vibrio parahaemolyticus]